MSSNKITKQIDKKLRPLKPKINGEFRIVNWNTDNSYRNLDKDDKVVDFVLDAVRKYNANVITLQELEVHSFKHLQKRLFQEYGMGEWYCFFQWFGLTGNAICVRGHGSKFKWGKLTGERFGPSIDWWGYMQVNYHEVTITNIHTRSTWAKEHVQELHEKVTSGIVAGDFNYENPESPGWFQTDLQLEPTWTDKKIDHILTVERPQTVEGDAKDKGGSNHRLIVASIVFPKRAKLEPKKPWIKRPLTKKPAPKKPPKNKSTTKKKISKKPVIKNFASKGKIVKKIMKKTR